MLLEGSATAEEADDKSNSTDDDEDDSSRGDERVRAADVYDVLITDDRGLHQHRDAAAKQRCTAQLQKQQRQ